MKVQRSQTYCVHFRTDGATYFTWINTNSTNQLHACFCRNDKVGTAVTLPGFVWGEVAGCTSGSSGTVAHGSEYAQYIQYLNLSS